MPPLQRPPTVNCVDWQRHFAIGVGEGIPVCCILDFIADGQHRRIGGRPSAQNEKGSWGVCRRCEAAGRGERPAAFEAQTYTIYRDQETGDWRPLFVFEEPDKRTKLGRMVKGWRARAEKRSWM